MKMVTSLSHSDQGRQAFLYYYCIGGNYEKETKTVTHVF